MPVEIKFGSKAKKENVTNFSLKVFEDILQAAGLSSALITSTARTPADQARVMYNNIVATSVAKQKLLYAAAGDAVIDEYVKAKKAGSESFASLLPALTLVTVVWSEPRNILPCAVLSSLAILSGLSH